MVLESQTARAGAGRNYMASRRNRGSYRTLAIIGVVAVVSVVCWVMIRSGGDGAASTSGGNGAGVTPGPVGPPPIDPAITPVTPVTPGPREPAGQLPPPPVQPPAPPVSAEPNEPPTPTPPPVQPPAPTNNGSGRMPADAAASQQIALAREMIQQNRLVDGRQLLWQVLGSDISPRIAQQVRREIAAVNEKLVFSPLVAEKDPHVTTHVVQSGEVLSRLAPRYDLPWRCIARINRITDPRRVRAGQRLKVVNGPFHLVIDKSDFRADLYLGDGRQRSYVRSFQVGLGEFDSTPVGSFVVRKHSKLTNPEWVNPRTNERFHPNNPDNPIGERWIGLRGTDEGTQDLLGYGVHGTIEPDSIGKESSMGCVRMLPDDIALVYDLLIEDKSTVVILP